MNGFNDTAANTTRDATADLFPLPLVPFERYMYQDDSSDYPMVMVLIIQLKGNLLRDSFEQSVQFALHRNPLLKSVIGKVRGKGPCWIPVESPQPRIDWRESGTPAGTVQDRIDLTREIGVRISVDHWPNSSEVMFEFHHACTDGVGGIQFIGDLLGHYGQLTAPAGAELPELQSVQFDRLRDRALFSTSVDEQPAKSVSCPMMLCRRLLKLICRGPVPLASSRRRQPIGTNLDSPAIISRTIDRPELQELKVAAAQRSVEVNDLYLLVMFQTIRAWNEKYGRGADSNWLRIGMPTSLRTPLHDGIPAANIVSYMFLTRRAKACDDPDELLAGIRRQTSLTVNDRLGRFLAFGLKYILKVPGLLWLLLCLNRCFCSVILTNVGDIRRHFRGRFPLKQGKCVAGNVTLEALIGSPPVRPNTRVSASLGTYSGNLYVNMHCDPLSFTQEQADEFADAYVDRLSRLTASSKGASKAA
ncbi:MAG: hypothetical protein JSS49_12690 [Planctomycetes bacterium]|nr:hypothetical protein [Planctomycetota bacterium]